jgi:hypothetical protein
MSSGEIVVVAEAALVGLNASFNQSIGWQNAAPDNANVSIVAAKAKMPFLRPIIPQSFPAL